MELFTHNHMETG